MLIDLETAVHAAFQRSVGTRGGRHTHSASAAIGGEVHEGLGLDRGCPDRGRLVRACRIRSATSPSASASAGEKKGEVVPARVIREDDLVARPGGKTSVGTFSGAVGSTSGRTDANVPKPSSPSAEKGDGPITEVEAKRLAARERLEASYESIQETVGLLWQAITQYMPCERVIPMERVLPGAVAACFCPGGDRLERAWRTPKTPRGRGGSVTGEVRDARLRHGMNDSSWDDLVRAVQQYRRR